MQAEIRPMNLDAEFFTPELCYINELSNTVNNPDVSIARARIELGRTTRWHRLHGITERYVILQGEGLVEVGDLPAQKVVAGDVVLIPPECRQRIANIGRDDLIFLAICSPRFQQQAYEDIDE
ncbi:cupin domain-containing protein [Crenothrix polyspora]|uniref:Cupin domain-containing protein n=1 Tax=Crenothrix polyspora TaxID=360316 RepID=A0A1R4H731_9GAMM|nr:cupin domain-containing protein [Crenothrix polyspora]SJM91967.1 Cupin domain-containing protein [Crenothrix polyspora]